MKPTSVRLIILVLLMLMLSLPTWAQDSTDEPSAAPAATSEAPVIINVGATDTAPVTPAPETPILSLSNLISFLVGGVVSAAGLMAWLGTQARSALNDPAKMVLAEKLGNSIPQESANKLIDGLTDVIAFLKEATDRQPALLKPTAPTVTAPVNLPLSGASTTSPSSGS